jgi:hypothetical protein
MKCRARIRIETRRRKGSGKEYEKVVNRCPHEHFFNLRDTVLEMKAQLEAEEVDGQRAREFESYVKTNGWTLRDDVTVCPGEIKVEIVARDEPVMGGSYAVLEIDYKCDHCGNTHFPSLPSDGESLSRLLEDAIIEKDDERTWHKQWPGDADSPV